MTRNVSAALQQAGARLAEPAHVWAVGDRVEYVGGGGRTTNRDAIGFVGRITSLPDESNADYVRVRWYNNSTASTSPYKANLRLLEAALSPLEAAKKLLEESGYSVVPTPPAPLPRNEVVFHSTGTTTRITVCKTGAHFAEPMCGMSPQTINRLVEAWTQVKAEQVRRDGLALARRAAL